MRQYAVILLIIAWGSINAQLAVIQSIEHLCDGNKGAIEIKILDHKSLGSFYWEDGDHPLNREELNAGTYNLNLTDHLGCTEELQVVLHEVSRLIIHDTIYIDPVTCKSTLSISVRDSAGHILQKESLNFSWNDEIQDLTERNFYNDSTKQTCLNVSLKGNEPCVQADTCIDIPGSSGCELKGDAKVIVNELYNNEDQGIEFVELVVLGDKVCGNTFDLRGHIIDDNNGEIIRANSLIFESNSNLLGIDKGYLRFSGNNQWKNIKNGTVLLITKNTTELNITYDPYDSNGDDVFILNGDEQDLFEPYDNTWTPKKSAYAYVGNKKDTIDKEVEISGALDGFQTRHADGSFDHGISGGRNSFSIENSFDLWITDHSTSKIHIYLEDKNYSSKISYSWIADDTYITPGSMNSIENQAIVDFLLPCSPSNNKTTHTEDPVSENKSNNSIKIHPNPSHGHINLTIQSNMSGLGFLSIHGMDGRLINTTEFDLRTGLNEEINDETISSGVYLLTITFPDGERQSKQLIRISH